MEHAVTPNGRESSLDHDAFIVSKTDRNGRIVYANSTFIALSGYSEAELLGSNHRIVRHPEMPRGIFKLMWDALQQEQGFHVFIDSLARDGSSYWAYASVVPSYDAQGEVIGYFSVRRRPKAGALPVIKGLYRAMCEEEARVGGDAGIGASVALLNNYLTEKGVGYEQFVLELQV